MKMSLGDKNLKEQVTLVTDTFRNSVTDVQVRIRGFQGFMENKF